MTSEVRSLVDQYGKWIRSQTALREIDEWIEITTPYLDRHNDFLQIFVRSDNSEFLLTDDGYIIEDLRLSGCMIDTEKRQRLLKEIVNGYGIQEEDNVLQVRATSRTFPQKKHDLVQGMLAINDLFYLASPTSTTLFQEDVVTWLDECEIRYTPNIRFTGKSTFDHRFDFVIPRSLAQPERILRTINKPSRDTAQAMVFSWVDIREERERHSRAYAILNDSDQEVGSNVVEALRNYDIRPFRWSGREEFQIELAT